MQHGRNKTPAERLNALHEHAKAYERTADAWAMDLRCDLAELILRALEKKQWSQKRLADACGKPESYISRIIHSGANCNLEVIATILHALDVKPALVAHATRPTTTAHTTPGDNGHASASTEAARIATDIQHLVRLRDAMTDIIDRACAQRDDGAEQQPPPPRR